MKDLDRLCINTIRTLSIDAVQRANSGHPGAPMGLAPAAYVLWKHFLKHNPANPDWPDRDRFVLSNGHASMLLYSLLHLTGYEDMTLEEIKNFRQWGSLTPGHPENHITPGVETTTGPLGQGVANSVGMALAEAKLRQEYDGLIDHRTWVICSDGDLMEGISHEAASLAGHLKLDRLTWVYDDNEITIDGRTDITFSEDVLARFESYGWHTQTVRDENDLDGIDRALKAARDETDRPSIIALKTTIGYGSPNKADTSSAHGAPLGPDEIAHTKEQLGWEWEEPFHVPDEVRQAMDATKRGKRLEAQWHSDMSKYEEAEPDKQAELARRLEGTLPQGWDDDLPDWEPSEDGMATRKANGAVIERLYDNLPEFCGGSADLAGSNKNLHEEYGVISAEDFTGQNIHFGVREHAMAGIANGMNLHGGVRAFGATFLIFSDYMRPSIRLAALMEAPTLMVYTHDSVGLGEDGPTHQPIEHLSSLRAIPNMTVLRPGDANEVPACWKLAIENQEGPSALVFTRQNVPTVDRSEFDGIGDASRGAYVLADAPNIDAQNGDPELLLLATGSEVPICLEAWRTLTDRGLAARLVSMPSWEVFEAQDADYRERILPRDVTARLAVEAAAPLGWERWVGSEGDIIGMERFGASAPWETNYEKFGFTPENIVERAEKLLTAVSSR